MPPQGAGSRLGGPGPAVRGPGGIFTAGCGGGGQAGRAAPHAKASPATPAAQMSITPGNGSKNVNPSEGVTVTAKTGKIKTVTATAGGASVAGSLNAAGK